MALTMTRCKVAKDTLFAAASYRISRQKAALDQTIHDTRVDFIGALTELLEPYFDVCGEHVSIVEPNLQPDTWGGPWFFLAISRAGETVPINSNLLCRAMDEGKSNAPPAASSSKHTRRHGLFCWDCSISVVGGLSAAPDCVASIFSEII